MFKPCAYLVLLFVVSQPAFARDLILHGDMHNGETMARGEGILSVHDELGRLNPGLEVQTIDFDGSKVPIPPSHDVNVRIRQSLAQQLTAILRDHPGQVRMLIIEGTGIFGHIHHLGALSDFASDDRLPDLSIALAPLRGRMAGDASVVLTADLLTPDYAVENFVLWSHAMLRDLGAPRGSVFAMTSRWKPMSGWNPEHLRTARFLTAGTVGILGGALLIASPTLTDLFTASFSAAGVPLLYLASRPLYAQPAGRRAMTPHPRDWVAALAASAAVLAAHAVENPRMALIGVIYGTITYVTFAATQFALDSLPTLMSSREGRLNTGQRVSFDAEGVLIYERLRADRDRARIFTCAEDLVNSDDRQGPATLTTY